MIKHALLALMLFPLLSKAEETFAEQLSVVWQSHNATNVLTMLSGEITTNATPVSLVAYGLGEALFHEDLGAASNAFFRAKTQVATLTNVQRRAFLNDGIDLCMALLTLNIDTNSIESVPFDPTAAAELLFASLPDEFPFSDILQAMESESD